MPGHPHQHVAVLIDLAVDVDVLAERVDRGRAHAVDEVWASRDGSCQDQGRRRAAVPRRRDAHAPRRLFTSLVLQLFVEHGRVRLAK